MTLRAQGRKDLYDTHSPPNAAGLSSRWIGLVTPLTASLARPLVDGLGADTTVVDNSFAETVTGPLLGFERQLSTPCAGSETFDIWRSSCRAG